MFKNKQIETHNSKHSIIVRKADHDGQPSHILDSGIIFLPQAIPF